MGFGIDLVSIASACGYNRAVSVTTLTEIKRALSDLLKETGPVFLEIRVNKGSRPDLGRPRSTPIENRDALMQELRDSKNT